MPLRGIAPAYRVNPLMPYHKLSFTDYLMQGLGRAIPGLLFGAGGRILANYLNNKQQGKIRSDAAERAEQARVLEMAGKLKGYNARKTAYLRTLNTPGQQQVHPVNQTAVTPAGQPATIPAQQSVGRLLTQIPGRKSPDPTLTQILGRKSSDPILANILQTKNPTAQPPAGLSVTPPTAEQSIEPQKAASALANTIKGISNPNTFKIQTGNQPSNPPDVGAKLALAFKRMGQIPGTPPRPTLASRVGETGLRDSNILFGQGQQIVKQRANAIKQMFPNTSDKEATKTATFDYYSELYRKQHPDSMNDPKTITNSYLYALGELQKRYGRVAGRVDAINALEKMTEARFRQAADFLRTAAYSGRTDMQGWGQQLEFSLKEAANAAATAVKLRGGRPRMSVRQWMNRYIGGGLTSALKTEEAAKIYLKVIKYEFKSRGRELSPGDYKLLKRLIDANDIYTIAGFTNAPGEAIDYNDQQRKAEFNRAWKIRKQNREDKKLNLNVNKAAIDAVLKKVKALTDWYTSIVDPMSSVPLDQNTIKKAREIGSAIPSILPLSTPVNKQ